MAYEDTNRLHPIVNTPNRKAPRAPASKKMASKRSFNATDSRESSSVVSKNVAAAGRARMNNLDIDAVFTRHEGPEATGDKDSDSRL